MTTLAEYAASADQPTVTLTTDDNARLITISRNGAAGGTNGLLQVKKRLTGDYTGYRILCTNGGGLAFNAAATAAVTGSPSAVTSNFLTFGATFYDQLVDLNGYELKNTGGYTGPTVNTTYYVKKQGSNITLWYTSRALAEQGSFTNGVVPFTGSGTPGNIQFEIPGEDPFDIGKLGDNDGGQVQIIETSTAYRFDEDNYASSSNISRFQQGRITLENVYWSVDTNETGTRSDFDFFVGTGNPPSPAPYVTLRNCHVVTDTRFNHFGSPHITIDGLTWTNAKNESNIEEFEFIYAPASVNNLRFPGGEALRFLPFAQPTYDPIVVKGVSGVSGILISAFVPSGRTSVPSGNVSSDTAGKIIDMRDYHGAVVRLNKDGNRGILRETRTVKFSVTGVPASQVSGQSVRIKSQSSGFPSNGVSDPVTEDFGSDGTVSTALIRAEAADTVNALTVYNRYRLTVNMPDARRWVDTLIVPVQADGADTAFNIPLTADRFPDNVWPSTISVPEGGCTTLSEIHRAIKSWEAGNPDTDPTHDIVYVDGTNLKINDGYSVVLSSTATLLVNIVSNVITIRCGATLATSNGLTGIDASGPNKTIGTAGTVDTSALFLKDSSGQKSEIVITNNMGASVLFSLVDTSNGNTVGTAQTIASGSTGTISIATTGLGSNYRVVGKRVGYLPFVQAVDLTGGGTRTITAPAQAQIVQPNGTASYVASVTVPATLTVAITSSGTTPAARIECGDATFSARQIFKAFEDEVASADGARYMGLGGSQVIYVSSALKGDEVILGTHTKVKRKASTDSNATIRATLYAPDDTPVDSANGDVQTIEGLNIPAVSDSIWSATTRTLTSASSSAPTAAQNAAAVWSAATRSLTSAAGLTATQAQQLATINNTVTNSTYGLAAMKTAQDMIPTTTGGSAAPTALYSVQEPTESPITVSAVDIDTGLLTIDGDSYDGLLAGDNVTIENLGGYTITYNFNGSLGSLRTAPITSGLIVTKEDDTNHKIGLEYTTPPNANNRYVWGGDGTPANIAMTHLNPQRTTGAANWTTPAWQVANIDTEYFKIDGGYEFGAFVNAARFVSTAKLQVAVEDTAAGDFDTWVDVPNSSWSNSVSSSGGNDDALYITSNTFTQLYELSVLSALSGISISNDKYIKFRLFFSRVSRGFRVNSIQNLTNGYLNLTILPSLTISGGASAGGLNQQQSTWLSNVNAAVADSTYGLSAIHADVALVPGQVWTQDLSGTQTDDTAGDLIKEASTNSGGGGGGGATAAQLWAYAMPSTPTAGSVAAHLKTASEDATAAKDDLANSSDGLTALKTAIDGIETGSGGFSATDRTNLGAIKTVTDALDVPTAAENATAVWDKALSTDVVSNTTIAPLGLNAGFLTFSDGDYAGFPNAATQITITEDGGVSGYSDGDTYWAGKLAGGGVNYILLFTTEALARDPGVNAGSAVGPGTGGTVTDIRMRWSTTTTVNHGAAKSVLTDIDVPTTAENATATWAATTRTLTASSDPSASAIADAVWEHADAPAAGATVGEIADAVWGENLSVDRVVVGASAPISRRIIPVSAAVAAQLNDGDVLTVNNPGSVPELSSGMTVYIQKSESGNNLLLFRNLALTDAINLSNNTNHDTELRLTRTAREYGDTARIMRKLSDEIDNKPTLAQIVDGVWDEIIDGGVVGDLTVTPTSANAGDGLRIPAADAALITNGDDFTVTATGGFSAINTTSTYYAYVDSQNNLYFYASREAALTPGATWIPIGSDGTRTSVRLLFKETQPIGSAAVVIHRIRTELAATHALTDTISDIIGADFIEAGLSLRDCLRIIVAVSAGKLSVTNSGGTFTFHRLDTGETAVLRANASSSGRTGITRDPT